MTDILRNASAFYSEMRDCSSGNATKGRIASVRSVKEKGDAPEQPTDDASSVEASTLGKKTSHYVLIYELTCLGDG